MSQAPKSTHANDTHGKDTAHHHPAVRTYVIIAVILAVITYIEYYIVEFPPSFLSTGGILFWLYALSIAKFIMVIMFFMHLKYDNRLLSGLFMSGLIIGVGTLAALLVLFELFNPDVETLERRAGLITATATATAPHDDRVVPVVLDSGDGEAVYLANCASCHQAEGQGVAGAFPQLTVHAPAIVLSEGGREYLTHVMLYGLQGEIEVLGNLYNGVMPAWPQLSDDEIRDVVNYIITAWGNAQLLPNDFEGYTSEEIAAERDLGLSPQDVWQQRQEIAIIEIEAADLESAEADEVTIVTDEDEAAPAEATPTEVAASWDWQDLGQSVYSANCASCHQAEGQGIPGAFPPLAGHTPDLYRTDGGRDYLTHVMLYGLQGEIEVLGNLYNGVMPAWPQLSDDEIAAVLNHSLTAWGNDALLPEGWDDYQAEEIAAERDLGLSPQDVWQQRQALETVPADETAPEDAPAEEAVADDTRTDEPAEEVADETTDEIADETTVEPVAAEATGTLADGVHTLSLSPDALEDGDTVTVTVQDREGNVYSTVLRVRDGLEGIEIETGDARVAAEPSPTAPSPDAPDEDALEATEPLPAEAIPAPAEDAPTPPDPAAETSRAGAPAAAQEPAAIFGLSPRAAPSLVGMGAADVLEADLILRPGEPPQEQRPQERNEDAPTGVLPSPTEPVTETEAPATEPATPTEAAAQAAHAPASPGEAAEHHAAAADLSQDEARALLTEGAGVYNAACVRCHLPNGEGRDAIASLQDNAVVQGDVATLAAIPHSGHGNMPSVVLLSDRELAAVLSFIRQNFNNSSTFVSEAQVAGATP